MTSIAIHCIYSKSSMIESIAEALGPDATEMHFWALEEPIDAVSEWTRGSGKGHKIELFNQLMACEEASNRTDYVMFLDDDLTIPPGFLPEYLRLVEALGADFAQPALLPESHHSFRATVQRPGLVARRTNWVEMMIFSMSRRLVDEVAPFTNVGRGAGWGFEFTITPALEKLGAYAAIIDACPVEHSYRPLATGYDFRIVALKGLSRLRKLGLTFEPLKVTGHCRELDRGWEDGPASPLAERLVGLIKDTDVPARIKELADSDNKYTDLGAHPTLLSEAVKLLKGEGFTPQVEGELPELWRLTAELIEVALAFVKDGATVDAIRKDIASLEGDERLLFLAEVYGAEVFDPPVDLWPKKPKAKS